ncbi:hypothetical protein [Roseivirga pacifica]|uniref:hypothetical protein n=1 Tax=Roseivirga pacifica TaxID=1267423 RepID=UPI00209476A3|nr:hypothetical protein [Roseivirga pacifica]MCO6358547.1 hypothetical protein [Roseivirga pacifica]MCO6369102.1 hypothetical protein [Roseivirga pacifica]MCO6372194.1 hypothetical protein [Roseivirga pacifica]MCO6374278.1 hypothetical protein [Roseivirga pacifica]MCO6380925.1 hypothetical protein [Roseivirga pacifica]
MNDILEGDSRIIETAEVGGFIHWLIHWYGPMQMKMEHGADGFLKITFNGNYQCKQLKDNESALKKAKWAM